MIPRQTKITILSALAEIRTKISDCDEPTFGTFICMLMAEYCKERDIDLIEFATNIRNSIIKTHEKLGKY